MFELTRLKVRGFRGFVGEQEFVFDHPVVLLFGENHRGKSSTLNAVEWCLFGDECVGKKTGIRERVGWEIANRYLAQGDVAVTAEFTGPNEIYKIAREQSVGRKRSAQKVTVLLPDGNQVQGDEAESLLYALFRSSFQDFMTTVYQHQEAIRAILTQEPRDRNEAIDRLLGLSPYREILRGITGANLERAVSDIESRREDFRRRCEQAIQTLENLIGEEKAKAVTEGITQEEMAEQEALRRAGAIAKAAESLARELGAVDFRAKVPAALGEIAEFREWVKTQTDILWAQAPDVLKQEALATKQGKLVTVKVNYQAAVKDEAVKHADRDNFVKKFGDEDTLVKAVQQLKQSIDEFENQIRETNAKANLVREAIKYLKEIAPEAGRGRCPLCGADAPDLLLHLEAEWQERIKAEVEGLEQQKDECQARLENTESLIVELEALERKLKEAGSHRETVTSQVADTLERKIGKEDDPLALLDKRLTEIDSKLKSTADAVANKRDKISAIYEQLGKLRTIDEILSHELRRNAIESIWRTREFTELDEALNEASQLAEDMKAIRSALAEASREEAEAKIHAAEAAVDKYFCCIAKHPAIPGLVMEVTEDRRSGLNSYDIKSKDGTDPTPILSQGDLNCLALSLFLGLSEATEETQRFAFLMLDDPTQSLGPEMKRELVKALEDITSHRKLTIATPDPEFKDLLTAGITKSKAIYNFVNWTQDGGSRVMRAT
jgi:exonuclease SbcC